MQSTHKPLFFIDEDSQQSQQPQLRSRPHPPAIKSSLNPRRPSSQQQQQQQLPSLLFRQEHHSLHQVQVVMTWKIF